jgi:hypothetical protein
MMKFNLISLLFHPSRSVLLCVVVERAKKCLDFAVTLFFFHLLACAFYEVSGMEQKAKTDVEHFLFLLMAAIC